VTERTDARPKGTAAVAHPGRRAGGPTTPAAHLSLESDALAYMTAELDRVKEFLEGTDSISSVLETRAAALADRIVIGEKHLGLTAQIVATEIQRRCERRAGELAREGQEAGEIVSTGQHGPGRARRVAIDVAFPVAKRVRWECYCLARAPADVFDKAVKAAKSEGSLSRSNLIRWVQALGPTGKTTGAAKPGSGRERPPAPRRSRVAANPDEVVGTATAMITDACTFAEPYAGQVSTPTSAEYAKVLRKSRTILSHIINALEKGVFRHRCG